MIWQAFNQQIYRMNDQKVHQLVMEHSVINLGYTGGIVFCEYL